MLRVLIVDDEDDVVESMGMLLEAWGHTIFPAFSGSQALALAEQHQPDAVLLDLGLPDLDGCDVARRLRQVPGMEGALILSISGYGQDEHRRRALDAGCDRHLTKPVPFDEVETLLAEHATKQAGAAPLL
ncbi:MAG TPA: response regulator [Gemmataceae bacterium]|nr:response regulator [Gemmataceae bacterium]